MESNKKSYQIGRDINLSNELEENDLVAENIVKNINNLYKRGRELNKEVPLELQVIIWSNQPVGSKIIEKYKEWFIEE